MRLIAKHYGVPVVLHSDHCAKKLLLWFDGMLEVNEEYFKANGEPLFFPLACWTSVRSLVRTSPPMPSTKRMAAVKLWLEMEIGITGGEEDRVDNSGVKVESLSRWINYC